MRFIRFVLLPNVIIATSFVCAFTACHSFHGSTNHTKVIVLGIDGMDPAFVERHWDALPNLVRLRKSGSFSRLGTSSPPQSPVAWSTFITGMEPAAHGIFDFVHRDPATLAPFSSMSRTEPPRLTLPVGPYRFPLAASRVVSLRKGAAFWKILADHGIPVTVVHMPTNYPPVAAGHAISGMGTPDLRGTQGTFTLFTDDPEELTRSVSGGRIVKVSVENGRVVLPIEGPPNSLRKDESASYVDLLGDVDPSQAYIRLTLGDQTAILREGEWSGWLTADFPLIAHLASARGMFRVFAKQLHPRLQLYVSAVNVDPDSPVLPISEPSSFSRDVAHEIGRYYTLGIAEDTSALRHGAFTLPEFLHQSRLVLADERKLLQYSLKRFDRGLLFFYFSSLDQNSHMLWGRHEPEVLEFYRAIDASVGEVMKAEPSAQLIVLSDHGFTTFDRAVHLNRWLNEAGFLTLNRAPGEDVSLADADWSRSEAYALGLNGLYVNLAGREKQGTIPDGPRRQAIVDNLRQQLLALRDPDNGRQVIQAMLPVTPEAQNIRVAPDLIVGYSPGYRASWQTALGGVPDALIEDNRDSWIGDHCIDPAAVPGVLFSSRTVSGGSHRLQDVTVSVLRLFGIPPAPGMSGQVFF
jgi:predicted AlkP superfamily phosphohydrolase/phosphomutase